MFKDEEEYDKLTTPTSAFIVFEEQEGANLALKAGGNSDRKLIG